jgi:hypothetical protein
MKSDKTSIVSKRKRYSPSKRVAESEARSLSDARQARSLRTSRSNNALERNYVLWLQTDTARQQALDLSDQTSTEDEIMRRAFNAHNLDWKNPFHWRRLLAALASAQYADRLPSGAKEKWTEAKRIELLTRVTTLRKEHSKWSEAKICEKLVVEDEAYSGLKGTTLQKQLQYARRLVLDVMSDQLQRSIREEAQRRGVARTAEFEDKLANRARMYAVKALSGLTPRGRKPREFTK